jgi:hypothetical protein
MWKGRALLFSLGAAQLLPAFGEYIWPAQTDALEDIIFNDSGFNAAGVGDHIVRCGDQGRGGPGAQVAATWVSKTTIDLSWKLTPYTSSALLTTI